MGVALDARKYSLGIPDGDFSVEGVCIIDIAQEYNLQVEIS